LRQKGLVTAYLGAEDVVLHNGEDTPTGTSKFTSLNQPR